MMNRRILLDEQVFHFSRGELPMLIHGSESSGASLFSITAVADLHDQGAKLLFLSGYPMARDEFIAQTSISDQSVLVETRSALAAASDKPVIFVPGEKPELFEVLIQSLPDISDRIIFLKNFELFGKSTFSTVSSLSNVVIAGDLDKCIYGSDLLGKKWGTGVYFSTPGNASDLEIPRLPEYTGYLKSSSLEGLVSVT